MQSLLAEPLTSSHSQLQALSGSGENEYDHEGDGDGKLPFTNIFDRGYQSTCAAWRQGQFVLQPTFAKSDKKFSTRGVLRAASVAADRSGNERAVRVSKLSAYVKRGTQQHKNIARLCDAWSVWSFRANFMFEPIL